MMEDDITGLTALLEVVSDGFGFSRKLTTFPVSSTSKIPLLLVSMVTNGRRYKYILERERVFSTHTLVRTSVVGDESPTS